MTIRIRRWSGTHEVSQSRKVKGPLQWVAVPTKQGRGYCRLVAKHGAAGLGVWLALVELAGVRDSESRGTIPGSLEDAALVQRLPPSEVVAVSETLIEIGWLEVEIDTQKAPKPANDSPATSMLPALREHGVATGQDRTGQKKKSMSSGDDGSDTSKNGQDEPWGKGFTEDDRILPPGLAYLWNEVAKQYQCPQITAFPERRKRAAKARAKEEGDPRVWADAMHLICQDPFLSGKNDRDQVYATFDYAMSSKVDRWLDEARGQSEETIP